MSGYDKSPDYTPPAPKGYARIQIWLIGAIVLMILVGIPLLASAKDWTYYNGVRVVDVDTLDFKSLPHHVRIEGAGVKLYNSNRPGARLMKPKG